MGVTEAEVTGPQVIGYFLNFLSLAILARAIISWISPMGQSNNIFVSVLYQITEPILAPLRRIIPRVGLFDFTPMIAILILSIAAGIFLGAG